MPLTVLCPMPKAQFFDNAGNPLSGGSLYTAQPGTSAGPGQSFPKATYTDQTGQTANADPVVLDSAGRANIWLNGTYAMALYDSTGVLIWTEDGVTGGAGASTASSVTQIFGDATNAAYNANILAANDATAPAYYEIFKVDASANPVNISPASGTVEGQTQVSLTVQWEGKRLAKNPTDNNWYKTN